MLSYLLSLLPSRLIFFSGLTSLCSLYLSVISALVFLLSLPLTSQIAFGMNLLPSSSLSLCLQAFLLQLCCCLPLREMMLSLFGGRALHQQVSSKYSHTPGRSPQNLTAAKPDGALSRVRSPYNRCPLGTCERFDAPAATERRTVLGRLARTSSEPAWRTCNMYHFLRSLRH